MTTTPAKGILIVFEGIDGTGKSTQQKLLGEHLLARGFQVVLTREPTSGPHGQKIRQLYTSRSSCSQEQELELFLADRREHVTQLIAPSLAAGKIVLCDRYYLSTAAYQGANGFDPEDILRRNSFAPVPDLALVFDLPIAMGLARITKSRGDVPNDFETAESLARVQRIFRELDLPCIARIDASQSIELIHRQVLAVTAPLLANTLQLTSNTP